MNPSDWIANGARWLSARLLAEAERVRTFIETHLGAIAWIWVGALVLSGGAKLALFVTRFPALATIEHLWPMLAGHLAAAIAPLLGYWLGSRVYPREERHQQPKLRLARLGRWNQLDPDQARGETGYGIGGLMVSLVAGLLVNLGIRLAEYSLAVPVIPAGSPPWAMAYLWAMSADLAIMGFFYSLCLAMALNAAPLFPRMLLYAWLVDLALQLAIARVVADTGGLPPEVTAPLRDFLIGNTRKVLISMLIWLPYLLLSVRVNVTFRNRIPAI